MKRTLSLVLLLALILTVLPVSAGAETSRTPIYVGNLAVDYMAEVILDRLELDGKSDHDKIVTVYDWIIANGERYEWDGVYRFDPDEVTQESQGRFAKEYNEKLANGQILLRQNWETVSGLCGSDYYGYCLDETSQVTSQAYSMMLKMTGSCASFTSLLTVLLGHLGYDSRQFHGEFINMDGTQVEHTWNYALIDGKWYWMDIRIDHAIGGGHQYFMKEDTDAWAEEHIWATEQSDWLYEHTDEIYELYAPTDEDVPVQPELSPDESVTPVCSEWAAEHMVQALQYGLIPRELVTQDLTQNITRREFSAAAVLLYEAFTGVSIPEYEGASAFTDTDDAEVLKAYSLGIVNGMGDGTFAPDDTLTREQASAMLGRTYELYSQGLPSDGAFLPQSEEQFSDHAEIFDYAKNYIYFFVGFGIIDGMGDGTFAPKGTMTREQALKIAAVSLENL